MEKLDDKEKKEATKKIKAAILEDIEDGAEDKFGDPKNIDLSKLSSSGDGNKAFLAEAMVAQGGSGKGSNSSPKRSRLAAGRQKMQGKAQKIKDQAIRKVKNQKQVKRMSKIAQDKQNQIKRAKEQAKRQKDDAVKRLKAQKKAMLKKAQEVKKRASTAKKSHASSGAVKLLTVITLALAILVDLIDLIGTLGVELAAIPTIIAFIINFCSSLIITITWLLIFSGSKGKSKKTAKVVIRSVLMLFGLENIPLVELLPFNAIAVVLNYLDFRKGNKAKK